MSFFNFIKTNFLYIINQQFKNKNMKSGVIGAELPKTMKAVVAYGQGEYKLELNYPTPECGPDDIIIKTEGCGVCAGDLKCYHGAAKFWGDESQPSWVRPPFIPGHEFLGHIVQMGENVKGYELGQRITADQIVPCGKCKFCKSGRYWMCQPHATFGFQKENNGGMAEYVRYPKTAVISHVPEDMPLEKALLIEPYGCSKHCVDRAQITNDDVVVIAGAGTLGLGMITYARMKNPALLIVLDMVDNRLKKAKEFGANRLSAITSISLLRFMPCLSTKLSPMAVKNSRALSALTFCFLFCERRWHRSRLKILVMRLFCLLKTKLWRIRVTTGFSRKRSIRSRKAVTRICLISRRPSVNSIAVFCLEKHLKARALAFTFRT